MQLLEKVVLENFRGFENYTLRLGQFNVLIGRNNSGKTSLIQAIQLVYDAIRVLFGGGTHPRFESVNWQPDLATQISRSGLSDTELIFFRKVPEGLQISAKWDNGLQLKFSSAQRTHFNFELLENGTSINSKLDDHHIRELITSVYSTKAVMLPPVGTISPDEQFISYPQMENLQTQGRYNETWRSNLYWIYNSGNKTAFDDVSEFVGAYIARSGILEPKLSEDSTPKFVIEYSEDSDVYDISSSGGGLRTLISLATILKLAKASCILLDEPDAHLHSELQRQVAEMLLDHTESQNVQMVIATHSPDIIDCVPLDSLLLIDRSEKEAYPVDDVGKALVSLGALTNSQAIAAVGAKSIINIEGDADKIVFSECAKKLGVELVPDPDTRLVRSGKKTLKELEHIRRAMRDFLRIDMKIAQINDLDYDPSIVRKNKQIGVEPGDGVLLLTLGRKEIENYLLDANAITEAVRIQLQEREQNDGEISLPNTAVISDIVKKSLEMHKDELFYNVRHLIQEELRKEHEHWERTRLDKETDKKFKELWRDEEWRLSVCPGKSVLRNIRTELQKRWGVSVSIDLLCCNMESVPKDIESILGKLRDFLTAGDEVSNPTY